ncbi:TfpX/TfpZ family type IV pilin accessory protein [Acinetobacter sp. ANC 3882]|uniref:TfpX/TfpZ family type IV pilin accessory protein n=1 Tax=Acinetobacter sp. ANC 3882 TaxID=2923423 RepID=UPI001F4A7830|nr:TfpX/TfpZ family type IV pilin accessory protein [Acinetobacter sp. ANC 3882]MCH7314054.1 type IV pilin accessory protein [Acinetobacter sp. ANC 3882]
MANRLIIFLSHLSISIVLALVIIFIIFFIWYPAPLASAVGVTHIFVILLAVDVTIGPLLGLMVYKKNKRKLKFDLTIIVLIQSIALGYGVYSIAQGRPAWLAYNVDRFELVRNNEILRELIAQASPQYQQPSWLKPQFVGVEFAKDKNIRGDEMFAEVLGGISIAQKPERYVPLDKVKSQIQQRAQSLDLLIQFNDKALVQNTLSKYPQATGFVPLKANAVDMTVLINREKGEVVKIVDLRPWK